MQTRPNFIQALQPISPTVKWVHHGRNGKTGLDCTGLIFEVYRNAGMAIDALDVPYGQRDCQRPDRTGMIVTQLGKRFDRIPVQTPREVRDGDVLLIGPVMHNHVALVVGALAAEMCEHGLRMTRLSRLWGFVTSIYRHRELI